MWVRILILSAMPLCQYLYKRWPWASALCEGKKRACWTRNIHNLDSRWMWMSGWLLRSLPWQKCRWYQFYVNKCPTRCDCTQFILSVNCSTCFGWFLHPSSRAQITVSTASGTSQPLLLPVSPDPARKLSANLYDIYHCSVYSIKHLMMDRG